MFRYLYKKWRRAVALLMAVSFMGSAVTAPGQIVGKLKRLGSRRIGGADGGGKVARWRGSPGFCGF